MSSACHSCGSLRGETPFPAKRPYRTPPLCCDCAAEATRIPPERTGRLITRASDRAARRWRQKQPQGDIIDYLGDIHGR